MIKHSVANLNVILEIRKHFKKKYYIKLKNSVRSTNPFDFNIECRLNLY